MTFANGEKRERRGGKRKGREGGKRERESRERKRRRKKYTPPRDALFGPFSSTGHAHSVLIQRERHYLQLQYST